MIPLKDDSPSALKPLVTIFLIVSCIGVFLWQRSLDVSTDRQAVAALGAIPAVLLGDARLPLDLQWIPRFASPFTSMFLHGGWMHLLGNMLFLWIYGDNVEDAMGHARYLVFYLLCGIAAIFVQALSSPDSPYPIIGASGGDLRGARCLPFVVSAAPRVLTLVLPLLLHHLAHARHAAAVVVVCQVGFDQRRSRGARRRRERGVSPHIGGFLTGMLLVSLSQATRRRVVRR